VNDGRQRLALALVGGCVVVVGASLLARRGTDTRLQDCVNDARELGAVMGADAVTARHLHEIDAVGARGRSAEAADRIAQHAIPAAEAALERARAANLRTRWGARTRAEALELLEARRGSSLAYAQALRSDSIDRVVREMETQRLVEKRALELQRKMREPPAAHECGPP
jgi:hypothetical protein